MNEHKLKLEPPVAEPLLSDAIPPHITHDDPLLACLVEITRIYGTPFSAQHLTAGLPLKNKKLSPNLLARAAAKAHCSVKVLRRPIKKLPSAVLPAILFLKESRACVLVSLKDRDAVVHYPESPTPTQVDISELTEEYVGLLAVVRPRYRVEGRAKDGVPSLKGKHWFWAAIFENWRLYRDALAAALLINIFALVMPLYTMNIYDRVVPNRAIETLWVLTIGIGLALFFNLLLTSARAYVVDKASSKVDIRLSAQIMERVLDIRLENRPTSVGSFAANLRSFESVRDFIASASLTTIVDLPFSLLFIGVLAWISPYMAIPPSIAVLVILIISFVSQRRLARLTKETFQASAQRNAVLVESLAGLETIKVLNAQGQAQQQWEKATEHISALNTKIKHTSSTTVMLVQFIQQSVVISIIIIGTFLVQEAQLSLGGIIASSMVAGRCLAPLGQVASLMMQYHHARTSLASIDNYMQLPIEHDIERSYLPRPQLEGAISFQNVSFQYPNTEQQVLKNISLDIKSQERIGIIGRIGSGKTTLAKLLLGLYQASDGTVLVDGVDNQQVDPADLRRSMGFVSQDPVLFYGTLKHNLTLGSLFVTNEEMLWAAKISGVDRLAAQHPEGYDMLISERGESLSGGQRQSIAVARALINNPSILILDEPTSNMDNQSELALRRYLKQVSDNRTLVVVTHRTALLDLVDRLVVLDQGKIVADGPKDQVVEALRAGRIAQSKGG